LALQGGAARESREQGSSDRRGRRRCSRIAGRGRGGKEGGGRARGGGASAPGKKRRGGQVANSNNVNT